MMIWNLANASPTTRAAFLIGFGVFMSAAAIIVLIFAGITGSVAMWIVGPLIVIVAATMLIYGSIMLRDAIRIKHGGDLLPVVPRAATGAPQPWSWQQLAGDIAARFEGTPYTVSASDARIRVTADLADAAFLTPAALRTMRFVYTTEVLPGGNGRVRLNDSAVQVESGVGADGTPRLFAAGSARGSSGRVMQRTRRIEFGADAQGIGKKVDIDFSSGDVRGPITAAVQAAGLRTKMSPNAKGALIVACIALLAVPLVPLMLWLKSIGVISG
ncbi:hypothetical protein [Agrococcus sp. KRD186]|uniref:hypothetical protein n=1 Tax=Agrococcus sp. KRD186 TaxID=2729730 RepID=UPI0019D270BF|nr:hypothetical protein [Agrococcus sp. KRD186]